MTRHEQESATLQERLQNALSHNKTLQSQLSEMKRKQAESDCKVLHVYLSRTYAFTYTPCVALSKPLFHVGLLDDNFFYDRFNNIGLFRFCFF